MSKKPGKKAVATKAAAVKTPVKAAKKAVATKAPVKKTAVKKAATPKSTVKSIPVKKAGSKASTTKTTLTVDEKSQTVSVSTVSTAVIAPVIEQRRLVMPPPPRPVKNGKKSAPLKPIRSAPTPVVVSDSESPWSAAELKAVRTDIVIELERLRRELAIVELEMDSLIQESGEGAGDDQADAGTKTFEREHEMSLVINARDMVLQTERALDRIDSKRYGNCEECGNAIGKARLQVFPRATLCMLCKQKEERR
ncbi:MAG: molecular chaperone DnaK-like protein [Actinobacteria bacterium]|jgi:RNA polymerase-binding transcription factor DksA|nr:molecular chaperone DnaK-like protein [Actinomycetota bacterium]